VQEYAKSQHFLRSQIATSNIEKENGSTKGGYMQLGEQFAQCCRGSAYQSEK
jgi:hypothetical protein